MAIDIKVSKNIIGGTQGWAYICNGHEIPVLIADFRNKPQEDFICFDKACVKKTLSDGNELYLYGNLVFDEDRLKDPTRMDGFAIESDGCCITNSFTYNDAVELAKNSQLPVIEEYGKVAICVIRNTDVALYLYKIDHIDSHCAIMCELTPVSNECAKDIAKAAKAWCRK